MLFVELIVKGLVYGRVYTMMAVGLTLVYGLLRILHIAHAGVFALGAYMAVTVANATGSPALGFLVATVVSAVAGTAPSTGWPTSRSCITRRSCRWSSRSACSS